MKQLLILSIIPLLATTSCKRHNCVTYGVGGLDIKKTRSAITDSGLVIYRYEKNSGFASVLDSMMLTRTLAAGDEFFMPFPYSDQVNGQYDYKLVFWPSNAAVRIGNMNAENGSSANGTTCVNPVHFTINDSECVTQGYLGMQSFYLPVEY